MSQHKVFKFFLLGSFISLISSKTLIPPPSNSSFTTISTTTSKVPRVYIRNVTESSVEVTTPKTSTAAASGFDLSTEQSEDVVSFGIRSFTVEVSSNEKLSSSTVPNSTKQSTYTTSSSTSATLSSTVATSTERTTLKVLSSIPTQWHESSTEKLEAEIEQSQTEPNLHQSETFNEISIDKKLNNGLYRIKIGEITTSEFNNAMLFSERQDERDEDNLLSSAPIHHEQAKVNIDDFFPSKTEDFNNVEKAFNTKNNRDESRSTIESTTSINTSNISTTKIEIELLGGETAAAAEANNTTEEKTSDASYIARRSKKFDPSMTLQKKGSTHDIGMTKFNFDKPVNTSRQSINGSPEFSTTKFYNSKELHNNILYKSQQPSSKFNNAKPATTSKVESKTASKDEKTTSLKKRMSLVPTTNSRMLSRLEEKMIALDCELQSLSADSSVWRGNETHELNLPITTPENCSSDDCLPMIISWEASADIQSGDVLIVEIDDTFLVSSEMKNKTSEKTVQHHNNAAVYQVTRLGHEHCDITEGELLDITPLIVDERKLVTLYDKDLTEGINLLIVVSELWNQQCVRLRVNVKSDNCGENAECSGKGICFSNTSMEGYECECCNGYVGPHCEEIDACTPSPCTNNGICVDLSQGHEGNSYQCLCPYGYKGKNCQSEADPCSPSQCLNGGTCVTNTSNYKAANSTFPFRCECPQGFTGPLCQHNLNECESSPCVHGICVDQEDGFRCFCQPGFSGDLCNFEYNECDSNPCVNGGQCIDHIGGFSCQCTRGYQGNRCHIKIDFCAQNPCEDGYRCVDHGDEYSCVCPGSGNHNVPDCTEVPRLLCTTNPCSNGGTCWTSDESFYCACRPGFTGKLCEEDFVIDTVVSSSELLSDVSDKNVITFDDSREDSDDKNSLRGHNTYITTGFLLLTLAAAAVTIMHCKHKPNYKRFSVNRHQLIPFFSRKTKADKNADNSKHWLSGKNSSFFAENHITLKNSQQPPQRHIPSSFSNNLGNEMHCSYSESQQLPLIP